MNYESDEPATGMTRTCKELEEAHRPPLPRRCRLVKPVRDPSGKIRFGESAEIVREVDNLGRRMLLVRFDDGATTFLFPDEVTVAVTGL
jgi:hypothetical protein